MIPKRIFQTWKTKNIDQPVLKMWQNSWKEKNPEYEYDLWDDADNRRFIEENYPDFLPIYDSYDRNIKRVDAVRYFYLYHYGGIYADLDFQCLKNFDKLLEEECDVILGTLGYMDNERYRLHSVPNAIMISKKNSDFFRLVIHALKNLGNIEGVSPETATGPIFLYVCLNYYMCRIPILSEMIYGRKDIFENFEFSSTSDKVFVTQPHVLYPINWDNKTHSKFYDELNEKSPEELFKDSYAVTYWMHSW